MSDRYAIVEKRNPHAIHGLFGTRERAEEFLREVTPRYVQRGYFMDKTLRPDDFEVIERT